MKNQLTGNSCWCCQVLAWIMFFSIATCWSPLLQGQVDNSSQPGTPFESSLDFVPADTAFYWSSQNNRQKMNALFNSRAFQELADTAVYRALRQTFLDGFKDGFQEGLEADLSVDQVEDVVDWLESDEATEWMEIGKQLLSSDVFVYGDDEWSNLFSSISDFYFGLVQESMGNGLGGELLNEQQIEELAFKLAEQEFDDLGIPTFLLGGKIEDTETVRRLLGSLAGEFEKAMSEASQEEQDFIGSIYRQIDDSRMYLLTLEISHDDLPWEQIYDEAQAEPESLEVIEAFQDWFKDKKIAFAIGIIENYLIFGLAPELDRIQNLGSEELLRDIAEFEPLYEHSDKTLSSISYVSEAMIKSTSNQDALGDSLKMMFRGIREASGDFGGDTRFAEELNEDIDTFAEELSHFIPEPSAILNFNFLTEQGIEGYTYNWTENRYFDDSQPLTILQHVGGNPALMFAAREKKNFEEYDFLAKWSERIFDQVQLYLPEAIAEEDPQEAVRVEKILTQLRPILSGLNQTTKNKFLPSLDGQSALVLDFKQGQESWHEMMPPASEPLPFPAFSMLMGIDDSSLFVDSMKDYFSQAQNLADMLKEFPESDIPQNYQIPRPESERFENGRLFSYSIFSEL